MFYLLKKWIPPMICIWCKILDFQINSNAKKPSGIQDDSIGTMPFTAISTSVSIHDYLMSKLECVSFSEYD